MPQLLRYSLILRWITSLLTKKQSFWFWKRAGCAIICPTCNQRLDRGTYLRNGERVEYFCWENWSGYASLWEVNLCLSRHLLFGLTCCLDFTKYLWKFVDSGCPCTLPNDLTQLYSHPIQRALYFLPPDRNWNDSFHRHLDQASFLLKILSYWLTARVDRESSLHVISSTSICPPFSFMVLQKGAGLY